MQCVYAKIYSKALVKDSSLSLIPSNQSEYFYSLRTCCAFMIRNLDDLIVKLILF